MAVLAELGLPLGPRAELAVHGWVAFAEECVIRSIDGGVREREALLDMLTKALPALVLASSGEEVNSLVTILTDLIPEPSPPNKPGSSGRPKN